MNMSTDVTTLPSNDYVPCYYRTHQEGFYQSWFVTMELGTKDMQRILS